MLSFLQGHAATVVMKLQLFIQEVNNSLDETSHQVSIFTVSPIEKRLTHRPQLA